MEQSECDGWVRRYTKSNLIGVDTMTYGQETNYIHVWNVMSMLSYCDILIIFTSTYATRK